MTQRTCQKVRRDEKWIQVIFILHYNYMLQCHAIKQPRQVDLRYISFTETTESQVFYFQNKVTRYICSLLLGVTHRLLSGHGHILLHRTGDIFKTFSFEKSKLKKKAKVNHMLRWTTIHNNDERKHLRPWWMRWLHWWRHVEVKRWFLQCGGRNVETANFVWRV